MLIVVICIFIALPPAIGWGEFHFRSGYVQCVLDFHNSNSYNPSYSLFSATAVIFFPSLSLLLLYSRILRTLRRNRFRVQNHPPVTSTAMHRKGRLFIDYGHKTKTSTTVILLSIVYMLSLFPIGIAQVYLALNGFTASVTNRVYLALLWLSFLHGALDPIIYYAQIPKFREAVRDLVPQFCSCPHNMTFGKRRRIRPHVMYQVQKNNGKIFITNYAAAIWRNTRVKIFFCFVLLLSRRKIWLGIEN